MCGYADLQMCGFFKLILGYVYKVDRMGRVLWKTGKHLSLYETGGLASILNSLGK